MTIEEYELLEQMLDQESLDKVLKYSLENFKLQDIGLNYGD